MDEKQTAKVLFKKLSALRATLSDDEQTLLDALVQGEYEVSAHGMTAKAAAGRVYQDADEAAAHLRVQPAADAKVTYRVVYNPDDEAYDIE